MSDVDYWKAQAEHWDTQATYWDAQADAWDQVARSCRNGSIFLGALAAFMVTALLAAVLFG